MIASIYDRLAYAYQHEVNLGSQILYLKPKSNENCEILELNLEIFPNPVKISSNVDPEGNEQLIALFEQSTTIFTVELIAKVHLTPFNPFDFYFIPQDAQKLPMRYDAEQRRVLSPYLVNETLPAEIIVLSNQLLYKANTYTSAFLMEINQFICDEFTYEIREEGRAHLPNFTLSQKRGSCRDFAVLFASICQAQGLATRFVSGYYVGQSPQDVPDQSHNLHAWVEVYLPGGGWKGFDPTQNEVVCGNHVALATSFDLNLIPPVAGYYHGDSPSTLSTSVNLKHFNNTHLLE